ncbi:MAG: PTS sugar transporter subunit IIA [Pseudomonadota bacterium]
MANLSNLLDHVRILDPLIADNRQKVLKALSQALADATGLDSQDIFEAIMERERLGPTGVGDGVAIPHTRLAGIERPIGAFARVSDGCDFEAIDDRPCDLVFMLLAPQTEGGDHLRALAQVARTFRDPALRAALRNGDKSAHALLIGEEQGAAA